MPHMSTDDLLLPFSGAEPIASHCSYQGAVDASERVGRQCLALLTAYTSGPLTDREAAERLGIERTTICARRNELKRRGLVKVIDTVPGICGVRNTRWGMAGSA